MTSFILSPYLGPAIGPIVCGFVAQDAGWKWVEAVMTIFTGSMGLLGLLVLPETYAPVLLRHRAQRMARLTGAEYTSIIELEKGESSITRAFWAALSRPLVFLVREPIVTLLSVYMAIIYGTLYSFFGAFPIVYQETRGWSTSIGGLAFIGVDRRCYWYDFRCRHGSLCQCTVSEDRSQGKSYPGDSTNSSNGWKYSTTHFGE